MTLAEPVDEAWQRRTAERRIALRRARIFATTLLVVMLILFSLCWWYEPALPGLGYPRAFAEAGVIGAVADWFAVVALFRRPMGLPIPHTAILPRNKQRMGDAMGLFIASNFLAPDEIEQRLDRIDASGWITQWLAEPDHIRLIVRGSQGLLPPALELLGQDQIRGFCRTLIRDGIDAIAATPMAGRILSVLVEQGYEDRAYDWGLERAGLLLEANRAAICRNAATQGSGLFGGWVDGKLTDAFITGLIGTLQAARAQGHPWRRDFAGFIQGWIRRLAEDEELLDRGEQIKSAVLDDKMVESYLGWLAGEAEAKLGAELASEGGIVVAALEHALQALAAWLAQDTQMRGMIDRWTRQLVLNAIVPNRAEIGAFVSDVLARWDTGTLVDRLELQVGKDLQYIRINGTLVGGLIGLIIFTVTKALR
jgi:uncharacterized membrane-anchored protein YjiN (DUF445 family)